MKVLLSFILVVTLTLACPVMNSDIHASEISHSHSSDENGASEASHSHSSDENGQHEQMNCCSSMEEGSIIKCETLRVFNSEKPHSPFSKIAATQQDFYFKIDLYVKEKNLFEVTSLFNVPLPEKSLPLFAQQVSLLL